MTNPQNIESKVDQTLASLDHSSRAAANPFLYTRVMASLRKEDRGMWASTLRLINRPAIALTAIVIVLLMNSLVFFQSSEQTPVQQPVVQEQDQIFASEYNYPQTTADRFYSVNEEQ